MIGTALITGASSGIGAEFARQLAARGSDLILVARRRDRLEQLAGELGPAHKVQVSVVPADLSDDADIHLVEDAIERTDGLDLLVNNAGFGTRGRIWEADRVAQNSMYHVHVLATFRLTQTALRGMVARGRGAVINVSSVAGFAASPGNASYCSTKAWMNTFTESVALELEGAGSPVRVQVLCPGFTYSEFHDVLGVDRALIPKSWWMPAEKVVADSLRGLERGELFVIPGFRYKLLAGLASSVPRRLRHVGTRIYARRTKRV
jgi:hypothetical protein